jgi:hypothetical protein
MCCNDVMRASSEGMVPLIRLMLTLVWVMAVREPISVGIEPLRALLTKYIQTIDVRRPTSVGSEPLIEFLASALRIEETGGAGAWWMSGRKVGMGAACGVGKCGGESGWARAQLIQRREVAQRGRDRATQRVAVKVAEGRNAETGA